ncbi:hypothetical protein PFISCL1PPCAC_23374, partial [Pristionchus fissidentatus]
MDEPPGSMLGNGYGAPPIDLASIIDEYGSNQDVVFSDIDTDDRDMSDELRDLANELAEEETRRTRSGASPASANAAVKRARIKLWEQPMDEHCVERSSGESHSCPICGTAHRSSGMWQHLRNVHKKSLSDAGLWIHCTKCGRNFGNEISWRAHMKDTECSLAQLEFRWREGDRSEGNETTPVFECEVTDSKKKGTKRKRKEEGEGGEIVRKKFTSRSREGETEEQARERKQRCLMLNRTYMQPRPGWKIVRQASNFKCTLCAESGFPTIPSLVWHARTNHNTQLSDAEHWIHCSGCLLDFASLSSIRVHLKEAAAVGAPCGWPATSISWQVEEGSEEARRYASGLAPTVAAAAAPSSAADQLALFLSAQSDGVKEEPRDEVDWMDMITQSVEPSSTRKHTTRADRSYMQPRPGSIIVRRQTELVCQLCGERGFPTSSSLDHHMRKEHKAGFHLAEMWMHCTRCLANFANMTSVRTHVKTSGGEEEEKGCSWEDLFMCWHEKNTREAGGGGEG